MAYSVALSDRLKMVVFCQCGNQVGANVFHWYVANVGNAGLTDLQIAAAMDTLVAPSYKALLAQNATYEGVHISRYWPTPPTTPEVGNSNVGSGPAINETALPRQACGIFTKNTRFAGRKYRGRCYVPFPGEGSNDALGVPIAAYQTALGVLGAQLTQTQVITVGVDSVSLLPVLQAGGPVTAQNYTEVTGYTARPRWATQRSRGSFGASE